MVLDTLLSRRLVILSGKGGVGKSVVGAALAVAAHAAGKRVLLVEIDAPKDASRYLGGPPAGPRETEVSPGVFAVNLDPDGVMEEYVRETVRVGFVVRKTLESPIYKRFLSAAPGLRELMVLGKIMVLEQARASWSSSRPKYDLIVVDAPATGHGLSFLKVPLAASQAVPVGPVGTNARRVLALLRDKEKTALAIVAIPEEMAVVEAIEFDREARLQLGMEPAAVILNGCHERRFTAAQEAEVLRLGSEGAEGWLAPGVPLRDALAAGRHHVRRRKMTAFYLSRLRKALDLPLVTLPHVFGERLGPDAIKALAERLEAA